MIFLKNHTNPTYEGCNQMNMTKFMAESLRKGVLVYECKAPTFKLDIRSVKASFKDIPADKLVVFKNALVCKRSEGGAPGISYIVVVRDTRDKDFFMFQRCMETENFSLLANEDQFFCTRFLHKCEERAVIAEL